MCNLIMSASTASVFAALAKMQASLGSAAKAKNGHGYKYADLAECIGTAKEPLAANGLAVAQLMGKAENGDATLITLLTHESGEYIGSEFIMTEAVLQGGAGKNPAQAMGASITYMRRYAYAAIIGLAQEDDDAAQVRNRQIARDTASRDNPSPMSDAQRKKLMAFYRNANVSDSARLKQASAKLGRNITTFNQLTGNEAGMLIELWENHLRGEQNAQ